MGGERGIIPPPWQELCPARSVDSRPLQLDQDGMNVHPARSALRHLANNCKLFDEVRHLVRAFVSSPTYNKLRFAIVARILRVRHFMNLHLGKKLPLTSLVSFSSPHMKQRTLISEVSLTVKGPNFIGHHPSDGNRKTSVEVLGPALQVIESRDAVVIGGSGFFILDGAVIHPDVFNPRAHVCMAEIFGSITIDTDNGLLCHRLNPPIDIEKGISLLGPCTGNYAHWLTETISAFCMIEQSSEYADFPLLVDNWIDEKLVDMLNVFNIKNHEIVRVSLRQPLKVKNIVTFTPPCFSPPEYRNINNLNHFQTDNTFKFNPKALQLLRNSGLKLQSERQDSLRLYIKRRPPSYGNGRAIIEEKRLERMAQECGFLVVEPSALSATEQIKIFQRAEIIVGPVGAALANAIFAPPGCKIILMAPYYENVDYYYFSNLMGVLDHSAFYVIGNQVADQPKRHPHHRDYHIDEELFRRALQVILNDPNQISNGVTH